MDSPDIASHLAHVATDLLAEHGEELTIKAVVSRAVEVVPDAEWASLTVRTRRHRLTTLAATDPRAAEADRLQYSLGEGPCLDSVEHSEWFRSGSVGRDPRWPVWGPRAAEVGVGSLLSVLAYSGNEPRGALNLYSTREDAFAAPDQVELALLYAIHSANALSSARLVEGLETAIGSRHTIGLAQGALMERFGLTVDQSFALLRRLSSTHNTKLYDVARGIIEKGELPGPSVNGESAGADLEPPGSSA